MSNELIVSKEYGAGALSREALAIRQTVFVGEQGVPLELEIDDLDDSTTPLRWLYRKSRSNHSTCLSEPRWF